MRQGLVGVDIHLQEISNMKILTMSPPDKSPMRDVKSVMKGKLRPCTEPTLHFSCLARHTAFLGPGQLLQVPSQFGFENEEGQPARSLCSSAISSGVIARLLDPSCSKRACAEMSSRRLRNRPRSNTPPVHLKPSSGLHCAAMYIPDLSANCCTKVLSAL